MALDLARWKKDYDSRKNRQQKDSKLFFWPLEKGQIGKYYIRLLPTTKHIISQAHLGWETKAIHKLGKTTRGYDKKVSCMNYHSNEKCPICELATMLYRTDDKTLRDAGQKLFCDRKYIYNALIYDKNHEIMYDGLPMKIYLPRTVQEGGKGRGEDYIDNYIVNDGKVRDIFNIRTGNDILFKIEMGDFGPNFNDIEIQPPTVISKDHDEVKRILNNLNDLKITPNEMSRVDYCDQLRTYFTAIGHDDIVDIMNQSGFEQSTKIAEETEKPSNTAVDADVVSDAEIDDLLEETKDVVTKTKKETETVEPDVPGDMSDEDYDSLLNDVRGDKTAEEDEKPKPKVKRKRRTKKEIEEAKAETKEVKETSEPEPTPEVEEEGSDDYLNDIEAFLNE